MPPRFAPGHFVYDVQSVGVVSTPRDTAAHPDTVTTHSTVTYEAGWDGVVLHVAGQVRYRVAVSSRVEAAAGAAQRAGGAPTANSGTPSTGSTTPAPGSVGDSSTPDAKVVTFEARIDTASGVVHRPGDSAAVPGCPPPGPVEIDETLATDRPRSLSPGAQWTDTLTRTSCLSGIPLTTRTIRVATVGSVAPDPGTGAQTIPVTYRTDETWDGEARRHADLIEIHATGSGAIEQYYDQGTGILLSAHTDTEFDLRATIDGRPQYMHQSADWGARIVRTKP